MCEAKRGNHGIAYEWAANCATHTASVYCGAVVHICLGNVFETPGKLEIWLALEDRKLDHRWRLQACQPAEHCSGNLVKQEIFVSVSE